MVNVNQDHSDIAQLCNTLSNVTTLESEVKQDVDLGTQRLIELNASSDALQCTSDALKDTRHFSNTLFNIMRGGIFDDNYSIEKRDFETYFFNANQPLFAVHKETLSKLSDPFSALELKSLIHEVEDPDFERLAIEYLPLKFSRRHGDPSRPWNIFSINMVMKLELQTL